MVEVVEIDPPAGLIIVELIEVESPTHPILSVSKQLTGPAIVPVTAVMLGSNCPVVIVQSPGTDHV